MATSFLTRFVDRAIAVQSVGCMGLDIEASHVPPGFDLASVRKGWWPYIKELIDMAAECFPVVKPQVSYYEALGPDGFWLLRKVVDYAHKKGVLAILDAKRNDIGKTMDLYGGWIFGDYRFDATTVNTYLGATFMPAGNEPHWRQFLEAGQMPIMMIRTSNPEGTALQDLKLADDRRFWEAMAEMVAATDVQARELCGADAAVGGVMGATHPDDAELCRRIAPDIFTLIPGYGTQGGTADDAVKAFPRDGRLLGTVNNSRGLTVSSWWDKDKKAAKPGDPLENIWRECLAMNDMLNDSLARHIGGYPYAE